MKNTILFICLFLFSASLSSQTEINDDLLLGKQINPKFEKQKRKRHYPNGIDFHLFGTSFHRAGRIRKEFFIGGEFGIAPDAITLVVVAGKHFSQKNTLWSSDKSQAEHNKFFQLFFLHAFVRWKPMDDRGEVDLGLRWAKYIGSVPFEDSFSSPTFYGLYIKPSIGSRHFKFGLRSDIGFMVEKRSDSITEFVVIYTPFVRFSF